MAVDENPYPSWMTPAEALEALRDLGRETAIRQLLFAARGDQLGIAAETTVRTTYTKVEAPRHYRIINGQLFANGLTHPEHNEFWRTGNMSIAEDMHSSIQCFRIRFDPESVRRLLPPAVRPHLVNPTPEPPAAQMTALPTALETKGPLPPKLSQSALTDWARDFGTRNPDAKFADFLMNARLHFTGMRVTERPMRTVIAKLGMTKTRGNPSIKRK